MLANIFELQNLECTYRYNQHRNFTSLLYSAQDEMQYIFSERKASSSWSFWLLKVLLHLWSF